MNHQEQQQPEVMEWLPSFLRRTFFGQCSVHKDSDLNRYCMSCHVAACKLCVASATHGGHNVIKIHRHVYKDVVPLADMEAYIDCNMIQPYRCNKKMVIALNPLPHCGSGKANKDESCRFCMRKLTTRKETDRDGETYHYCSIACKFQVTSSSERSNDSEGDVSEAVSEEDQESQNKKRHRRKGIPCRAPLS